MRKKILILSFSQLDRDPRVTRQITILKDRYHVVAVGLSDPRIDGVEFIPVEEKKSSVLRRVSRAIQLKRRRFEEFYWSMKWVVSGIKKLVDVKTDLIICNDISGLPLCTRLARKSGAKLLLDAHEYAPLEFDENLTWRFLFKDLWDYVCKTYLRQVHAMITVSHGIADEYEKIYGVKAKVMPNAPNFANLKPSESDGSSIRMIHHGGLRPSQKVENMIFLMDELDERFYLDFMFVDGNTRYFNKLRRLASKNRRIGFKEPVPLGDVLSTINEYDVGLHLLSPTSFNNQMALPNKFFEFIQARLALAIWPSPEMARITKHFQCGIVAEDFSIVSMARKLNSLTHEGVAQYKKNTDDAARELCSDRNKELLVEIVESMISP